MSSPRLKICQNGHRFYKSSDCPVCPICEKERIPESEFLFILSAPARRALENKGINTLEKLAEYTEPELMALHGFGKSSLPKLQDAIKKVGLSLKNNIS